MTHEFLNGINTDIEQIMKDWGVPGLALAIVKDGEIIHSKGYGYRDISKELPVTPNTLFAIGSVSKSFTSAAISILVDDGLLDLDKPITNYMPSFRMNDPVATERITARDILSHRTGLPRHDMMWYNSTDSREKLVERVRYLELNKDIRTTWQYNNLMYTVAGYLVEAISGMTWEAFVQKRIFDPLGMTSSHFSVNDSKNKPDYALPYLPGENGPVEVPFRNLDSIAPAGSINSNINDMAKWLQMQLGKGKFNDKQIVSECNIAQMHAPQIPAAMPWRFKELTMCCYGLGWIVEAYRGNKFVHHNGGIDGFIAYVTMLPEENLGSVILCNMNGSYSTSALAFTIFDRYLGIKNKNWNVDFKVGIEEVMMEMAQMVQDTIPTCIENTKPSHDLDAYVGKYESLGYGIIEINKVEDGLTLTLNRFVMPLTHHHYDLFTFFQPSFGETYKASFIMAESGNIESISIPLEADPSVKPIVFKRI